jgi:very-short-patch-repair endonuclease
MIVTNQDLIVHTGGGHQTHYPIWKDEAGVEYISRDGFTFVRLQNQEFKQSRRETVVRK